MHLVKSKRDKFFSTYCRKQLWSLPSSIIYYIARNASSLEIFEKLIKSCKLFFIMNPVVVVSHLSVNYEDNELMIFFNGIKVDIKNFSSKILISDSFYCYNVIENSTNSYIGCSIIPKICHSTVKEVTLITQILFYNDLLLFGATCEKLLLYNSTVFYGKNSGSVVLEDIFAAFPVVKVFRFLDYSCYSSNVLSCNTVDNLLKIPHFKNLICFELSHIPECFDIYNFFCFIKITPKLRASLHFDENISEEYGNRLLAIVNEIIDDKSRAYCPPYIWYSNMSVMHLKELNCLFHRNNF